MDRDELLFFFLYSTSDGVYISYIPSNSRPSMIPLTLPLDTSPFTLSTSGVAGLVGGDEAVLAMAAVHVYESRRWLGWYNSPGSYQIAKRLSLLTESRIPDNFSLGVHTDPTKLVKLDITKGPKFRAAHSGTVIEDTGHVGSLVMKECAAREGKAVGQGRKTGIVGVTIVRLNHELPTRMCPERTNHSTPIFASIPITVGLASYVACGIFRDWWAFSLILLGILANGISSAIIGCGKLQFTHPDPAKGSPPGDGILVSGKEIVLLIGAEGAVNSITRGSLSLNFSSEVEFRRIEWCPAFLIIQFIAQLLLIPQASLFGQVLFVVSLAVSWFYNSCLASFHKDKIQRDILFKSVLENPTLDKYTLGTFTSAVVFALLVLRPKEPNKFLDELLPNDTEVWRQWKETIVQRLLNKEMLQFAISDGKAVDADEVTEEGKLLEKLYSDARAACSAYAECFPSD